MSIVTKTGDDGTTATFGGKRVPKNDKQIEASGAIDEATSFIGWAGESITNPSILKVLSDAQLHLYQIMAHLSGSRLDKAQMKEHISKIERAINYYEHTLPKLTRFILPQGSEQSARLHIARAKVRMAERRVVGFLYQNEAPTQSDFIVLQYMNRLSDLLFLLARVFDKHEVTTT